MKNLFIGMMGLLILIIGVRWSKSPRSHDSDIIAETGLHSHPILEIYVNEERQIIPANIGIGPQYSSLPMGMSPVHTHDDAIDGVIHLEFSGTVRKNDIRLEKLFRNWGRDIDSFGSNKKMIVNGVENTEFGNYIMKDRDKIELRYN